MSDTFSVLSSLRLRDLEENDVNKNFLALLEQLSIVGKIPVDFFVSHLRDLRTNPRHKMVVVEDVKLSRVCGTGTLIIEPKFIRNAGLVGHVEDVVVDAALRKKGIGRRIIAKLCEMAQASGCYKTIVDCSEANVKFYESCGFKRKECSMALYFHRAQQAAEEEQQSESLSMSTTTTTTPTPLSSLRTSASRKDELIPEVKGDLILRLLRDSDYPSDFLRLLSQLTEVGNVSEAQFRSRIALAKVDGNQFTFVIEEESSGRVVGTGTVFMEKKFIHNAGLVAHIEDIVVDSTIRGKGLGILIIDKLVKVSQSLGCYKVILDCSTENIPFYKKCGFHLGHSPVCMAKYFEIADKSRL